MDPFDPASYYRCRRYFMRHVQRQGGLLSVNSYASNWWVHPVVRLTAILPGQVECFRSFAVGGWVD